jgi:hypothetical protein
MRHERCDVMDGREREGNAFDFRESTLSSTMTLVIKCSTKNGWKIYIYMPEQTFVLFTLSLFAVRVLIQSCLEAVVR